MKTKIIVPFRDRGHDPLRQANLDAVTTWWDIFDMDFEVVSDGLEGDAQFNRHRAYNLAVEANPDVDVFVFSEADMLIPPRYIDAAAEAATGTPGLVVPFDQYRYLSVSASVTARSLVKHRRLAAVGCLPPESVKTQGTAIGAISVVSRETLEITGGFTEYTSGNWYDDDIISEGFSFLTGNHTRTLKGIATHLYHLPGWKGDHLTQEDKDATDRNKRILTITRGHVGSGNRQAVHDLMLSRGPR